jgi:chromosome segregation ATPase
VAAVAQVERARAGAAAARETERAAEELLVAQLGRVRAQVSLARGELEQLRRRQAHAQEEVQMLRAEAAEQSVTLQQVEAAIGTAAEGSSVGAAPARGEDERPDGDDHSAASEVGRLTVRLKRLLDQSPWLHFTSECQRF